MPTAVQPTATTRFRYIADDDVIYVGEAEFSEEDITILSCYRIGMTLEEVYPYDAKFPATLRNRLEVAALECRMTPPVTPAELPSDWNEIEVLAVETEYTIVSKVVLPDVKSDLERQAYGLSTVQRVSSINGGKQYRVKAKGAFVDVRRELHRIRLF